MKKLILNLMAVAFLATFLPSCSKKTTAVDQPTTTTQPRQQQTTQQKRGERPTGNRPTGDRLPRERPQFSDILTRLDANKDGKLALSEAKGRLKETFSQVDANADGFITETEFKNAPKPQRKSRN